MYDEKAEIFFFFFLSKSNICNSAFKTHPEPLFTGPDDNLLCRCLLTWCGMLNDLDTTIVFSQSLLISIHVSVLCLEIPFPFKLYSLYYPWTVNRLW